MKLSTRKILAIELVTLSSMLLTLLIAAGIAREYAQISILMLAMVSSIALLGIVKPRGENYRAVAVVMILMAIVWQVVTWVLCGMKLGFVQNVYGWNLVSWSKIFLPIILTIVSEEILRGQLVDRGRGNKIIVVSVGVLIWLIQIITAIGAYNFSHGQEMFSFVVAMAGPAVLTNLLLTYVAYRYDYRANIGYRLVMELPLYMMPILPDVGTYLPVIFQIGLMLILTLWLIGAKTQRVQQDSILKRDKILRPKTEGSQKWGRGLRYAGTGFIVVIVVGYVMLMSGLFRYHFLAIGSGSMEPNISRGDMVLVEKSKDYEHIQEGDILVYRHSNMVVVHRVVEVSGDGGTYSYHTKGDANGSPDVWQVDQSDVIGVARGKIVKFGFPTLWLNELFNREN